MIYIYIYVHDGFMRSVCNLSIIRVTSRKAQIEKDANIGIFYPIVQIMAYYPIIASNDINASFL